MISVNVSGVTFSQRGGDGLPLITSVPLAVQSSRGEVSNIRIDLGAGAVQYLDPPPVGEQAVIDRDGVVELATVDAVELTAAGARLVLVA